MAGHSEVVTLRRDSTSSLLRSSGTELFEPEELHFGVGFEMAGHSAVTLGRNWTVTVD